MGSPNRLARIFGDTERLKISELTPKQSQAIGSEVLRACRSQLKYLDGFVPFVEYLLEVAMTDNGCAHRTRDDDSKMYPLPVGFDGNTKCRLLMTLHMNRWESAAPHARRHRERVYRQQLLLTNDGALLRWDWYALCERTDCESFEVAIRSRVRLLEGRRLEKYLRNPTISLRMLSVLGVLVEDTLAKRRVRYMSMADLGAFLSQVVRRIEVDAP
jgi:hypothetical protein